MIIRACFYENYLVLNANKCHFLTVGLNELIPDFPFNNTTIENVIEEKILGVVIDNRLNFKFHLKAICEKAYGLILRISPYSVQMLENTDQKNYVFGHFSHNEKLSVLSRISKLTTLNNQPKKW